MDPPWKVQNPASSSAILTILMVASLFKGLLSQKSKYTLTVPDSVTVQHGLCVHIPCSFTPVSTGSEKLYGYWFQKKDRYWQFFVTSYSYFTVPGILATTNDNRVVMQKSVKGRFRFTGKLTESNCSFSILDAKPEDAGEYYFRIESSKMMYEYKTYKGKHRMPLKVHVTALTEKPQIRNNSAVLSGKEAVFTCSAPGPCFEIKTKVLWTTILLDYKTLQWHQYNSNGSWTYGSNFIFTPSIDDQGKWLTCWVWYPNVKKKVANTIFLDVDDVANVTRRRQLAVRIEFWGSSVSLFLIILYLFKVLLGFLFFVSVICLLNWKEISPTGE